MRLCGEKTPAWVNCWRFGKASRRAPEISQHKNSHRFTNVVLDSTLLPVNDDDALDSYVTAICWSASFDTTVSIKVMHDTFGRGWSPSVVDLLLDGKHQERASCCTSTLVEFEVWFDSSITFLVLVMDSSLEKLSSASFVHVECSESLEGSYLVWWRSIKQQRLTRNKTRNKTERWTSWATAVDVIVKESWSLRAPTTQK